MSINNLEEYAEENLISRWGTFAILPDMNDTYLACLTTSTHQIIKAYGSTRKNAVHGLYLVVKDNLWSLCYAK